VADLEALVRKFVAGYQAKDFKALGEMWTEDAEHTFSGVVTKGRDNIRANYARMGTAFDSREYKVERIHVCGNVTVNEYSEWYTQLQPVPTQFGKIEPGGTLMHIHGASIMEWEGELIKRCRVYSDGAFQMLAHSPAVTFAR